MSFRNFQVMTKQKLEQAKVEILAKAANIECPFNVTDELKRAYSNSRAIDEFLTAQYFPSQKSPSKTQKLKQIKQILKTYEEDVSKRLLETKDNFDKIRKKTKPSKQNLFLVAGTKSLFLSNQYTRTITTTLGNRLEFILEIDKSKCFDTETNFNLKIPGIDKFVLDGDGKIRHVQVKTKKDTLTGSQVQRSKIELGIHPNPIFAALFDFGGWHFPKHEKIARMTGNEFWSLVGLDYETVLDEVCKSLRRIEKVLY